MTTYRAIVSIAFDDDDLKELAENLYIDPDDLDPDNAINGELDSMSFGSHWVEQLFEDGKPTIRRLSGGIMVEVNPHEEAA